MGTVRRTNFGVAADPQNAETGEKCPNCDVLLYRDGPALRCPTLREYQDNWYGANEGKHRTDPGYVPWDPPCRFAVMRVSFLVAVVNVDSLSASIAKLASRAKKTGTIPVGLVFGARETHVISEANEAKGTEAKLTEFVHVTLTGELPQIEGWTFAAALDHDGQENVVRSALQGGAEIPARYRIAAPQCDHCKANRRRVYSYVLRHESGEWIQVGKQCLKDFLGGHESAASLAASAECILDAIEACRSAERADEESEGGFGRRTGYDIKRFLARVSQAIRLGGWVSRKMAEERMLESTASAALCAMYGRCQGHIHPKTEPIDTERAEASLAWARSLGEEEGGSAADLPEYLWNLRAACRREMVDPRSAGIVASVVVAWDRTLAQHQKATSAPSEWFGEVKVKGDRKYKRPTFTLTVERVILIPGSEYGDSYLHLFVDSSGNRATWKTTARLEEGKTYSVKCTVDAHENYWPKGKVGGESIRQTKLSRCDCTEIVPAKDGAAQAN